jgi:acyl-CoA synthetase (AMP-forming)/AMP-acid ligase II
VTALLSWLDAPSAERGIRFATADGWTLWTYRQLAGLVRTCAGALVRAGVPPGGRVTIVEEGGPRFVGLFFGAMLAGATPSPVAPRPAFGDRQRYDDHLAGVLRATEPDLVVHAPGQDLPAPVRAVDTPTLLSGATSSDVDRPGAEVALVQFTSGTTGGVKGVRVPYPALETNVRAIAAWLEMGPQDATASWLPVHHDMGLVGCLLAPVVTGSDLWLMSPAEFVRNPVGYLACFGREGAGLTAMPAFGLDHVVRRVRPAALAGMDFSRWRAVIVGAERVTGGTLERFAALGAPYGLSPAALLPAYGLAEATLAVTGLPLRTGWRSVPRKEATVVGCGSPLTGVRVAVLDGAGRPVPEGVEGEIVVGGDSVADGYLHEPRGTAEIATGDAGFLQDGQLYVLGRLGDSIKIRGRTLFAEDLDAGIGTACTPAQGRVATLLGTVGARTRAVVLMERPSPDWVDAARAVARMLAEDADLETIALPSGAIPRTSSGKPRRRELWRAYLAGALRPSTTPARTPSASGTR